MNPFELYIREARNWVKCWDFIEIREIGWRQNNGAGGLWYPPHGAEKTARIILGWDESTGGLWHEIFHSVTHNAPLMKTNGEWCEGWCCAFSEVQRGEFTEIDPTRAPTNDFERRYQWPVFHLLHYAHCNRQLLQALWFEWNYRLFLPGQLSQILGYNPMNTVKK